MVRVGIRGFVDALQRSGLAPVDTLRDALAAFRDASGKPLSDAEQLANYLIDLELVTAWQCEKLLTGKHKGFQLGDYLLLGHLGTGGMSTVYLARQRDSGLLRAIKVLPRKRVGEKSYLERFRHEAEATRRLDHPSIVKAFELGHDHETYYYVMEFCSGQDVSELVKERGPLDFKLAARIAAQTARALAYAHGSGLIHRDIKPANLLVDSQANVKLLDLGLAMSSALDAKTQQLFRERVIGTADYLSPEQGVDSQRVDQRTDLYSLGCTLYFMLTGQPPFPTGSLRERIEQHLRVEPRDVRAMRPDCPHELIAICRRLMMKRPGERYQDARQAYEGLSRWLASRGFGVDQAMQLELATPTYKRHVAAEVSAASDSDGSDSNVFKVVDIDELEQKSAGASSHLRLADLDKPVVIESVDPAEESEWEPIPPAPLPTAPMAPIEAEDPLSPHAPLSSTSVGAANAAPQTWPGSGAFPKVALGAGNSESVLARRRAKQAFNPLTDWRVWLLSVLGFLLLAGIVVGVIVAAT